MWASLAAEWLRIYLPMQEMQVQPLVWEDPLEKEMQPNPVFLPGKSHGQRSLVGCSPWGHKRVRHDLSTKQQRLNYTLKNGSDVSFM